MKRNQQPSKRQKPMFWLLLKRGIRQFPKWALVAVVLVGSTALFGVWWFARKARQAIPDRPPAVVAENLAPKLGLIESKPGRLLLVDNDLYDLDSGAILFKEWLKRGMPLELFYDAKSKKILARYERGFIQYSLDGREAGTLLQRYPPVFSDDRKRMFFVKEKDIWRADVDWSAFKLSNEQRVTSIEQFSEASFAQNIQFGTDRFVIIRNVNQLLRVNLETGDVKPTRVDLTYIAKRRSPDGRFLFGVSGGQIYTYDVENDKTDTAPIGRTALNDCQWLDNNRCVALLGGEQVALYDRKKDVLDIVCSLPGRFNRIGEPSPDGHFVFCAGRTAGVLVDLERKQTLPITGGGDVKWVSNDTFAFSREVPDSDLRGTWLQTVGQGERRVSPEPYLVQSNNASAQLMVLPSAGLVIFMTKHGISKMKLDGSEVTELVKLARPPTRVLWVQAWGT